ncbi:hypothetical protein [Aeromonas encheleia]
MAYASSPRLSRFHQILAVTLAVHFFFLLFGLFSVDMGAKAGGLRFLPALESFSSDIGGNAGGPLFLPPVRVVFIGYLR